MPALLDIRDLGHFSRSPKLEALAGRLTGSEFRQPSVSRQTRDLEAGLAPLMPRLFGSFLAAHPATTITVKEISTIETETALEEGRMDVGLNFLTHHS